MLSNSKLFALVAVCALSVTAQDSSSTTSTTSAAIATGTAGPNACILNCMSQAASDNNCSSFSDLPCVCNLQFQYNAIQCLSTICTPTDLASAQDLQSAQCGAVSGSSSTASGSSTSGAATGSAPTGTRSASSGGSASSGVSSGASTTPSGNGVSKIQVVSASGALAAGLSVLGAILGGAFVL